MPRWFLTLDAALLFMSMYSG
uniref:Uncharacterized protein n=1 Tax=Rhizophora mucronata TaxID=61149 RepID=A0A2P2QJD8_RHIMU